jgi:hypothetical protein
LRRQDRGHQQFVGIGKREFGPRVRMLRLQAIGSLAGRPVARVRRATGRLMSRKLSG